jgi:PadR family transcriptional regulator PadR
VQDNDLEIQFEKWQLQLRKGVLIYMVLVLLDQGEMYGYALISALAKKLETDMAEGTIYPILNRMVRRGIVTFDWRIMESGPARKYYQISDSGRELLSRMHDHWKSVDTSLQGSTDD